MELHLHSHHWVRRLPDWTAAVVAGLAAGALLMVLELLWAAFVAGDSPWRMSHRVAAIVGGRAMLEGADFGVAVVGTALVVHYLLGVGFAVALALVVAPYRLDSSAGLVAASGALFGAVLYLVNFYVMVELFPWFAPLRGLPTLLLHLLFGISAALAYRALERRRSD